MIYLYLYPWGYKYEYQNRRCLGHPVPPLKPADPSIGHHMACTAGVILVALLVQVAQLVLPHIPYTTDHLDKEAVSTLSF